jgi:multiple sugar transport system permease protein
MSKSDRRNLKYGLIFVAPWLIGLTVFNLYPIAASFYFSLCDYSVLEPARFVGGENYADLFSDEVFHLTLRNTFFYAALALPMGALVAFSTAVLLNTGVRGMAFYRTIYFLPSLVPSVASAILWLWVFNGEYGVLNHLLSRAGVKGPGWLSDPAWSKPALVMMSVWGVGHSVVIYLAGLQDVPQQLYEAAELDGANWFQKLRHATIPMVSPVILFNLIMGIIGSLQIFALPYIMLPGGQPARSAYFYAVYLYDNAFPYLQMGYASAMSWIMFVIILGLTFAALRLSRRHVHYGGA